MHKSSINLRRLLGVGATAAIGAAAVNASIFGLGRAADLTYIVKTTHTGPALIHLGDVVSFSLMTFAVGLIAALVAARVGRPSLRTMQGVGVAVAVLTIGMDLPIDATAPTKATLALMHLVVGGAYVGALHFAARRSPVEAVDADATALADRPAVEGTVAHAA